MTTQSSPISIHPVPLSEFNLDGLAPALHDYVDWGGYRGPIFDHHLYRDVNMLFTAALPADWPVSGCPAGLARINEIVADAQRSIENFEKESRWAAYVFAHHRPYRVDALLWVIQKVGVSRLWRLVGDVWRDSESNMQSADEWEEIWSHAYAERGHFRKCFRNVMGAKDRRTYDALPEIITAYRGCFNADDVMAYSWTLDRGKAEWFAERKSWNGNPVVAKVEVHKSLVLAYFGERGEAEVVLDHNAGLDSYEFEFSGLPTRMMDAA